MPTLEEKLNHCAVRVNEGSGCVYQPGNTNKYSYILTVKHNIKSDKPEDIRVFRGSDQTERIKVKQVIIHESEDIAVLTVDYQGDPGFHLSTGQATLDEQLRIFGYPKYLNDPVEPIPTDIACKKGLEKAPDVSFELISEQPLASYNKPAIANVVGFSGSGIFKYEGDEIILKGIFPKLNDPEAAHNKVVGYHISIFNELLIVNSLPELIPAHLISFEFLKDKAFELSLDKFQKENLGTVLSFLRLKAKEIVDSDLTPTSIKDKFNKSLLIDEDDVDNLSDIQVWQAWLELLTVLNIARKEKCSLENIEKDFDLYRLKYLSTTDDWTEHFHSIQYADYKGLKTGKGKVFVKTFGDSSETGRLDLPEHMVVDIAREFDFELLKTDSGSHPFKDFKFYHIDYLKKKCIRDNEESLTGLTEQEEILNALKDEYSKLFG